MTVAQGDLLRLAVRQRWAGTDDIVNVLHYEVFTVPAGGAEEDVLEDLADGISLKYAILESSLSDNLDAVDISVYNITQDGPVGTVGFTPDYSGGSGTGDSLPTFVAGLIFFPTSVKRRVGRLFVGGLTEATGSAGFVAGATVTVLQTFGTALLSLSGGPNNGVYRLVVYSRANGVHTVPNFARVAPLYAIQQRRKRGRGS